MHALFFLLALAWGVSLSDIDAEAMALLDEEEAFSDSITLAEEAFNSGVLDAQKNNLKQALAHFKRAANLNPHLGRAFDYAALCYERMHKYKQAIKWYKKALKLSPQAGVLWNSLGICYQKSNQLLRAIDAHTTAEKLLKSGNPASLTSCQFNLGVAKQKVGDDDGALRAYEAAIRTDARNANALINMGVLLERNGMYNEAKDRLTAALEVVPDYAEGYNNLAVVYEKMGQYSQAFAHFAKAAELKPDYETPIFNMGDLRRKARVLDDAKMYYEQVVALNPTHANAMFHIADVMAWACDWNITLSETSVEPVSFGHDFEYMMNTARSMGETTIFTSRIEPFFGLMFPLQPLDVKFLAEQKAIVIGRREPLHRLVPGMGVPKVLKIGLVSTDFRPGHPLFQILNGFLATYDRTKLQVYCYDIEALPSLQEENETLKEACSVVSLRGRSDQEAAEVIAAHGVHVLFDCNGWTLGHRHTMFAHRPAPVQVLFGGYPGTSGSQYLDYIVGDHAALPDSSRGFYSERFLRLPYSWLGGNNHRETMPREELAARTRSAYGLPDDAVVYANFGQHYKIDYATFRVWCRIVGRVPGSVMWLIETNSYAHNNLRKEWSRRGLSLDRLVFTPRLEYGLHIGVFALADVFLDTPVYNGGVTSLDTLWAGVPIVTVAGDILCRRMGASLVSSLGSPWLADQMITDNLDEYENTAIKWGNDPPSLREISEALRDALTAAPLYNPSAWSRALQEASRTAFSWFDSGLEFRDVDVANA